MRRLVGSAIGLSLLMLSVAMAQSPRASAPTQAAGGGRAAAAAAVPAMPRGNAEHGQYIAEHVAMCVECHSGRDERGNIVEAEKYLGGPIPFAPPWPNNWANRAPRNKGLLGYDDAKAMRLLTQGAIGRDGTQLRPPMPRFRMSPQDAADVIAFLRTTP